MSSVSSRAASFTSQSTDSSAAPLAATRKKDSQAAFASLQSRFGFSGWTPAYPRSQTSTVSTAPTSTASLPACPKDFQPSLADLQLVYGFGSSVPSPIPKPKARSPNPGSTSSKPPSKHCSSLPKTKIRYFPRRTTQMIVL
ncbi:hypothetical protein FB45DRAFT_869808 [Roridomyces roridus]|uniref:Uncharacterized protein n=1 Tax=Roridomyces roridus TaxID=1738132 RepID=A0AAD7BJW2_9AGAR|nr:hypothetical protein FB45DRAFT_869808 [Roridomyces roridus]